MKIVRIVSDTPSDAADLISFLQGHGFTVQNDQVVDPSEPLPDFEIDLRVLPVDTALQLAREMASSDVDVFVGTGIFPEVPPPAVTVAPLGTIEAPTEIAPVAMEPAQVESLGMEPISLEWIENDALRLDPVDVEPVSTTPLEIAPVAVESFAIDPVEADPATSVREPAEDPFPVVAAARLRESIVQMLREARLTGRECLSLCSAELLNGLEQTRQHLEQARVLLIRKRTVIEARAVRARSMVENHLRFDSASQNAWIRSAFAGAGLMVVLIALMLWKDQRSASATIPMSGAASSSVVKSPTPVVATPSSGTSATATLRHKSSERIEIVDDREVVIHHFDRQAPKTTTVVDAKSGIKHISDMN